MVQIVQPQPTCLTDPSIVTIATRTNAEATVNNDMSLHEADNPTSATNEVSLSKRLYLTRSPLSKSHGTISIRQSPVPKRQRSMRTGTESSQRSLFDHSAPSTLTLTDQLDSTVRNTRSISLMGIKLTSNETKVVQELSDFLTLHFTKGSK